MIDSIAHSPYQVGKDDPIVKNLQNFLNFNAEQIEVFLQYCHYADLRQTEEINIRKEGMKLCTELMMKLLQKRKTTPPPQTPVTITTNPPPTPPAYLKNNTFIESQNVQQQQQQTSKNNNNVVDGDDDVDFGIVEIDDIYEDDDEDEDDSLRFAPPPHNTKSSSSSSTTITKTPKPTNKRVSIDLGHKSPTNHANSKRKDAEEGVPIDYYALPRRKVPSSRHIGSCLMQKSLSPTSSLPNTPKTILDFTLPKGLLTLKSHPQLYTIGKFNDVVIGKFREKFKIFMKTIPTTSINLQTSKTCSNNPCLENELLILQSLGSYPTIFSCYGSIVEGSYFHIIYPLPVYGSLLHIILEGGGSSGSGGSVMNIPTPLIIAWMYDLSDAIQFLHCHGIVHQNITAENCYLFDNLQLKLGNFQSSYSIYDNDETTGNNINRCNNNNNSNEQRQQRPSSSSSSYSSSIPSGLSSVSSLSTPTNNSNNQNNNNCYVSEEAQKLLPQFQIDMIGFWNTSLELISRKPLDKILLLLQKQNKEQLLNTSFLLSNPYILNHFPKLIPSLIALLRATLPTSTTTPLPQQYEKKGSKLMMTTSSMINMSSKELSEELYNLLEVQFQGDPRERVNQRFKKSLRVFEQSIQHLNVHVHTSSSSSPTSVSSSFSNFFPMKSLSSSSSSSSSPHPSHPPAAPAGTPSPSHLSSFFHLFGSNKKQSHDRPQSSPHQQQQQQLQSSPNNTTSPSTSSLHLSCTTNYFSDLTSSQQARSLSRSGSYRGVVTPSFDKERMVIDYRRELVSWLVDKVKIKVALAEEVTVALIKHGLLIPEQIKRKHREGPKALTEQLSGKIDADVLQKILKYLQ